MVVENAPETPTVHGEFAEQDGILKVDLLPERPVIGPATPGPIPRTRTREGMSDAAGSHPVDDQLAHMGGATCQLHSLRLC